MALVISYSLTCQKWDLIGIDMQVLDASEGGNNPHMEPVLVPNYAPMFSI